MLRAMLYGRGAAFPELKELGLQLLRQARELGYATDEEEYVRGMNCVAVPILDKDGMPTSSIWVTGPSERLRSRREQGGSRGQARSSS